MALIEIGSQKQLFLDDYLIESMTQAKQGVNPRLQGRAQSHHPVRAPVGGQPCHAVLGGVRR